MSRHYTFLLVDVEFFIELTSLFLLCIFRGEGERSEKIKGDGDESRVCYVSATTFPCFRYVTSNNSRAGLKKILR